MRRLLAIDNPPDLSKKARGFLDGSKLQMRVLVADGVEIEAVPSIRTVEFGGIEAPCVALYSFRYKRMLRAVHACFFSMWATSSACSLSVIG